LQFTRLRLQGFKSFVEPTDLDIPAGLTGIVGPNGCGKSNLVEALRWVMGENSPRRMRGSGMEDMIFSGTATRPSRNLAEVVLELDNSTRSASSEFNNDDVIQVTRQIERGNGSDYRINGKPVRQRDVQLLFADQATGAHSTNLVGQGQIDALIRAKPQDRRQVLEEASGTAGLHARRHEAELKLKGAEQNLTRVDDVLKAYDTQLRNLKQQVRQASRYRNLAEHIRRVEAALFHIRWLEAGHNAEDAKNALQNAEERVKDLLIVVTQGNTKRAEIAAELPGLRQTEVAAAAIVQKLALIREQIEAESKRLTEETDAQHQHLAQTRGDYAREQERHTDGIAAIAKLESEQKQLGEKIAHISTQIPDVVQALTTVSEDVENLYNALTQLTQEVATTTARKQSLEQEITSLNERQSQLIQRREQLDTQRVSLATEVAARPDLSFALALLEASEKELAKRQQQAQGAEDKYRQTEQLHTQARDFVQQAQAKVTKLRAEAEAITAFLHHQDSQTEQVIDLISVTPGIEKALAVAVGEALTAGLDTAAAMHWRTLPSLSSSPTLPDGILPISQYIEAPVALIRCLSQIGLADNAAAGERAALHLHPGQIIVTRDGWAWRWDGFTVTPEAKTATALRLQQRNRLAALKDEIMVATAEAENAASALDQSATFFAQHQAEDRRAREALQAAFAALNDARATYTNQEKEATAITTKLATLDDSLRQIHADLAAIRQRASAVEDELKSLPNIDGQHATIAETRTKFTEQRSRQIQYESEREQLAREQALAQTRQTSITEEIVAWQARLDDAAGQMQSLATRVETIEGKLAHLQHRPAELQLSRAKLLTELSEAEAQRKQATDCLIETEQRLSVVEHKLKQDESILSENREGRVRAEAAVQAAAEHFSALRERMLEKLNCTPEELPSIVATGESEETIASELEQLLARYMRERENMGPVNLRAEVEADALQFDIDKLQQEKDDLVAAIAKLRQGISHLNREARERLQNAFTLVNERFQVLFKRLFNGGKAHLELIDAEDPMESGLEIFASPPGKKMQILSLLSGGERTLTALALIFAVFQTNPSPICVLDEAEAALDESNIDRFCTLVEDIARETGTRFLIITHQRLTMARMDRLYGVTMSEKGVSQLVSVDLAGAVAVRDGGSIDDVTSNVETALQEVRAA
jgi:chromosome segregation protein